MSSAPFNHAIHIWQWSEAFIRSQSPPLSPQLDCWFRLFDFGMFFLSWFKCCLVALWTSHSTALNSSWSQCFIFSYLCPRKMFMEVEQKVVMDIISQVRTSSSSFPAVSGFIPWRISDEGPTSWWGVIVTFFTGWLGFDFYHLFIYPLAYFQLHHLPACVSCPVRLLIKTFLKSVQGVPLYC